ARPRRNRRRGAGVRTESPPKGVEMKRIVVLAAAAAVAAALAAAAQAKGPTQASIAGPGLKGAIVLKGDAEGDAAAGFPRFVEDAGFFPTVFARSPDPTLRTRPKGVLGPRYVVTYLVPGPNDTSSRIRQELYPY